MLATMASDSRSLSQETSSTSSELSVNIKFENLYYKVRSGILSTERKDLLKGLSGHLSAGKLTAIVGRSGAGKTTLMNILAGYTKQSSGCIEVNGEVRNEEMFLRKSCYIMQDDMVQGMLTIRESISIAAELKLGNHISQTLKTDRVETVIKALSLQQDQHTRAMYLSGGQKKRLAIGLELVSDPPVMFLDEPTSGLDSLKSVQLIDILHMLASQGRTVVVSMHQPSARLLERVDQLYAVVEGRCAYTGSVPMLLHYLGHVGLPCPPYNDPIEHLIDIVEPEKINRLSEGSLNGKSHEWAMDRITHQTDCDTLEIKALAYNLVLNEKEQELLLSTLPAPKENTTNILKLRNSTYATSWWKQFSILTKRSFLLYWRDPTFARMIMLIHVAMALFVGCLFYNIGHDGKDVLNNFNYLYFCLMFLMFTAFSAVTVSLPQQFPAVRREHFNRWYMTGAHFMAALVSAVPVQTLCTISFATLTYWLTGQPLEFVRFLGFCWTLMMVAYVALNLGLLNGSMFNVKLGVIFGPFFLMPFTVFSGFFLSYKDAPNFFKAIFHTSFLKHGLVGLVLNIYGYNRPKLPCSADYCHFSPPKTFLVDRGMDQEEYWLVVVALVATSLIINILTYLVLKFKLNHWHQVVKIKL